MIAGRLPTTSEVASAGSSEAGLRSTLRGLLEGDGFHQFILEGTNDRLLTASASQIVDANYVNFPIYRNMKYAVDREEEDTGIVGVVGRLISSVDDALALAPGELIYYIASNDRSYAEVVTANYMMMNPIVNAAFGGTAEFVDESDSSEFQPGVIDGFYFDNGSIVSEEDVFGGHYVTDFGTGHFTYPHAGIINTPAFLKRYPTTATNRNRARARWTFFHFLDIDIEKSSQRPTDPEALADTNNPTLYNPNCTACHAVMDPVAGAFQNYNDRAFYRLDGIDSLDGYYKYPEDGSATPYQEGDTWYRDMRAPGLFDRLITDDTASLAELAELIIQEPGFARAAVKFWWPTLMGSDVLLAPAVAEDVAYQAQLAAYNAQAATIEELSLAFSENFNIKDLLVDMMLTPWFSAERVANDENLDTHTYAGLGSKKLLTPERLQRKTLELTGFNWRSSPNGTNLDDMSNGLNDRYRLYYGGIDSFGVTERSREMTPLMSTVPMSLALESACPIVVKEFALEDSIRKLFFGITGNSTPLTEASVEVDVSSSAEFDWQEFSLSTSVSPGLKVAQVSFPNPYCDWDEVNEQCLEQRVLFVDKLEIRAPGESAFTAYDAKDSELTHPGCWASGPDGSDVALYNSCSVLVPVSVLESGEIEIRVIVSAQQGGDEITRVSIALLDGADPHESQWTGAVAIREKLVELHQILLGKSYSADSAEIAIAYNLLVDSWLENVDRGGSSNLLESGNSCYWSADFNFLDGLQYPGDPHQLAESGQWYEFKWEEVYPFLRPLASDSTRMKQSWVAVLTYMMTHYFYLYE